MIRGIVFKGVDQEIILLTMDAEHKTDEHVISDYDNLYATMEESKADIVEWDTLGQDIGLANLRSIYGMTFHREGAECPARNAIRHCIENNPAAFLCLINEAV